MYSMKRYTCRFKGDRDYSCTQDIRKSNIIIIAKVFRCYMQCVIFCRVSLLILMAFSTWGSLPLEAVPHPRLIALMQKNTLKENSRVDQKTPLTGGMGNILIIEDDCCAYMISNTLNQDCFHISYTKRGLDTKTVLAVLSCSPFSTPRFLVATILCKSILSTIP